ncbi:calcium/sodium:proton antiporter [Nanobdella aerobiophila]|uniref:Calcium/sodium:proton antiporter n=1 Tax=Nanobdella aerobiophila TaxID=2586965 RepID=A0A915SD25_9ARCH|nr:hypothetical protein [Nanobdella aerobiophila]BBL45868.1 calcium/sodium:proton antiporter [Nanobdella aerobiophila]
MNIIFYVFIAILIPLLLYAFVIYLSENILLKYVEKYSKYYSSWPKYYLLVYTAGIASALQSFLPGLLVDILGKAKLAFYFQLYNVALDYTVTLGTFILAFNFNKGIIDKNLLVYITISYILELIFLSTKVITYFDGIILYLSFIIMSIIIFYKYRTKKEKIEYKEENSLYSYFKALVYTLEIGLAVSLIYVGGNVLNNISNTLSNLGFSIPLIGFLIAIILFTLPDIIYGHLSWFKEKDLNTSIASITGEEISEFTIFTGILAMIHPIVFTNIDVIPIISTMSIMYVSILILFFSSYRGKIPRWVGIILIVLGLLMGFVDGIVNI